VQKVQCRTIFFLALCAKASCPTIYFGWLEQFFLLKSGAEKTALPHDDDRELGLNPHCVTLEWIVESMKRGRRVPEADFAFPPPTATSSAATTKASEP
jgi:hypothetical protein